MDAATFPRVEITLPPLPKRRYGLLSVAQQVPLPRPAVADYKELCPGTLNVAPDPCDTPVNKETREQSWGEMVPFWAYVLTVCGPRFSNDSMDGVAYLSLSEEYALEVRLDELLTEADNSATVTDDLLEVAAGYRNSTLVLTVATALELNSYLDVEGEGEDARLFVKATGQPVTVSPAYTVNGVITGPIYARDPNPEVIEEFDTVANQTYQLVEGLYAVGASCEAGLVRLGA